MNDNDSRGSDPRDLLGELGLIAPRLRGAPSRGIAAEHSRDLTLADLAALNNAPRGVPTPTLKRIHASHHALAKCLATGMANNQAGLVTGYDPTYISILRRDPAFMALVADYKAEVQGAFANLAERMSNVSLDAIEMLQERLHTSPQDFGVGTLLDIVKTFADRTGHGPGQEVKLTMTRDTIDRPPRETFDEWQERRKRELLESDDASLGTPTGTTN